jgi:alkylation response protein AidB-like acyl-CoA dehydrogenase
MSTVITTRPGELGSLAAESIKDMIGRAVGSGSVATYAERESPLDWSVIADGGWDLIGVAEDGEQASLRDLVEVARVWGTRCIQLPLLPSILAKRHSPAAQEHNGPVSFAIPSATLTEGAIVPYGQLSGLMVAGGLEAGEDRLCAVVDATPADSDILLRAVQIPSPSIFSTEAAREVAVVLAAEATGAAAQLLDDGVAFAKQREQFGRPIGSFQAVKHMLADALILNESAETAAIWASLHPEDAFRGALYAIDRSIAIGELVLQVHGGIGFTWELGLHFYLRRMVSARELVAGLSAAYG